VHRIKQKIEQEGAEAGADQAASAAP
jgi:hypothetical protein